MDVSELCVIFKDTFDENTSPVACLGEKWSASINQASVARNDSNTSCIPGQKVHQECRQDTAIHNKYVKKFGSSRNSMVINQIKKGVF